MKRLLVAGGTGFVGYHVCKFAVKKNISTFSISKNRPSKKKRLKGVIYLNYDLKNKKKLQKLNWNYDYIINCSGYGKLLSKKANGINFYKNHTVSLKNIVELSNKKSLKKIVQLGSSSEYGMIKPPQRESAKCKPINVYGKAKLACTNYLLKCFKKYKLPCVILRLFQIYGPFQQKNKLIPFVVSNAKKNKKFKVTHGNQLRDFLYIEDLVQAIFKCLNNKKINGKIINLGYGYPSKLYNIINNIVKKIGNGLPLFGKKHNLFLENLNLYPDISKAKKLLKWKPKINLQSGINKILR